MKRYIQHKYNGQLETIDEFPFTNKEERIEFRRALREYQTAMPQAEIYASSRPCKDWK